MSAKCNGIIKFSLSQKWRRSGPVPQCPLQNVYFLFSQFSLRLTKKKTFKTNICVNYVIYKFCLRLFSLKCIIKKNYLSPLCSLQGCENILFTLKQVLLVYVKCTYSFIRIYFYLNLFVVKQQSNKHSRREITKMQIADELIYIYMFILF